MQDEDDAARGNDPLAQLVRQDLDPLSVAELEARIRRLESEIERTRARLAHAGSTRAAADALFGKGR